MTGVQTCALPISSPEPDCPEDFFNERFPSLMKTKRVDFELKFDLNEPIQPQIDKISHDIRRSIQKEVFECCLDKEVVRQAIKTKILAADVAGKIIPKFDGIIQTKLTELLKELKLEGEKNE